MEVTMPEFAVTIRMVVTKTYVVEADNADEARDIAHDIATPRYEENCDEDYNEECMDVELLKECTP